MPPRTKASIGLTSLIESDSEPDFDSFDAADVQTARSAMRSTAAPKRTSRGRPPTNKVTKPAQKATTRKALEEKSSNTARPTRASKKSSESDGYDRSTDKPAQPKRGRPKKSLQTESTDSVVTAEIEKPRSNRGRRRGTEPREEILETQQPDPEEMEVDEENNEQIGQSEEASPMLEEEVETNIEAYDIGAMDDEDVSDNASLQRRLAELTSRYKNLETRHQDLRDVAIKDAERNFERLKKQAEENTQSANRLIEQLKAELAAQTLLAKQAKVAQHKLDLSEGKCDTLQTKVTDLNMSLSEARSEIKTLNTKLVAARNAEAVTKVPGSALKPTNMLAGRQAQITPAVQEAQAKEDLYGDLTGLIIRGLKNEDKENVFDCIQTGRNGTLHFKLAVDDLDSVDNYEDVQYTYRPQLDEGRDGDLMDILPDYLVDDITFPRLHASRFYARVVKSLTERLEE